MGAPLLWFGLKAKLLKSILNINDAVDVIAGAVDPSSVATAGEPGSIYLSSNGGLYVKQDSGTSTNWLDVTAGGSVIWGAITGTLSSQLDLQAALDAKQDGPLTGGVTTSGDVATVITNANLTGDITSTGNATTLGSNFKIQPIGTTIDGGSSAPSVGQYSWVFVPYACTVNQWTVGCDDGVSGNCVVDVQTCAYGARGTETSIAGSELPTLTGATENQDSSLRTWTPSIAAGTWVKFEVVSASTLTKIYITLRAGR